MWFRSKSAKVIAGYLDKISLDDCKGVDDFLCAGVIYADIVNLTLIINSEFCDFLSESDLKYVFKKVKKLHDRVKIYKILKKLQGN